MCTHCPPHQPHAACGTTRPAPPPSKRLQNAPSNVTDTTRARLGNTTQPLTRKYDPTTGRVGADERRAVSEQRPTPLRRTQQHKHRRVSSRLNHRRRRYRRRHRRSRRAVVRRRPLRAAVDSRTAATARNAVIVRHKVPEVVVVVVVAAAVV